MQVNCGALDRQVKGKRRAVPHSPSSSQEQKRTLVEEEEAADSESIPDTTNQFDALQSGDAAAAGPPMDMQGDDDMQG